LDEEEEKEEEEAIEMKEDGSGCNLFKSGSEVVTPSIYDIVSVAN